MSLVVVVASPLLVPRARSSGGAGGRRVEVRLGAGGGLDVVVLGSGSRERVSAAGLDALAAAQVFNHEVEVARRAGLTSRPEPVALSVDALERARAALGE